jgi:hypothetical protein
VTDGKNTDLLLLEELIRRYAKASNEIKRLRDEVESVGEK